MSLPTSKSWDETILRDPSNPNHSGIPWQFLRGSKGWRELQKIINFLVWGLSSREINQGETGVFFNVFVFVVFPPSLDVLFQESWYDFSEFRAYVAAKSHYEEFDDFNFFFLFYFLQCKSVVGLWGSGLAPRVQPQSVLIVLLANGFSSVNSLPEKGENGEKIGEEKRRKNVVWMF